MARFDGTTGGTSFRGWLFTITRSKLVDFFRGQSLRATAEGGNTAHARWAELPEAEPDESLADPQTGNAGVMRRALEAIRRDFEAPTFRAFWETSVEERAVKEVAAELGLSLDVVYQTKSRVLRRHKQDLQGLIPS